MGLQVGHHIPRQIALSYRVNSIVSTDILESPSSASEPVRHEQNVSTVSKRIYKIAIRGWERGQDWRQKIIHGSRKICRQSIESASKHESQPRYQGSLSVKHFNGWQLAWHLATSESQFVKIGGKIQNARMAIGRQPGKLVRSNKKLKSTSQLIGNYSEISTRAGTSLLVEIEKMVRQMMVLTKSNEEFRASLEGPALEKNRVVQQIMKQFLAKRADETDSIFEVGAAVRKRYLENSNYHKRNKEVVLAGNEAAHNGDALTDALLYHPNYSKCRKDDITYSNLYGFPPRTVWLLRNCDSFIQVVSWYGTVKRWHPHYFASTPFAKAMPANFFTTYSKATLQEVQAAFADKKMDALMKLLKSIYSIEAEANRSKYR